MFTKWAIAKKKELFYYRNLEIELKLREENLNLRENNIELKEEILNNAKQL